MKKIILVLAVLIAVMACSKTTEPVNFEDQLTELCEDYGYCWGNLANGDYYIGDVGEELGRIFEEELRVLAVDSGYLCSSYYAGGLYYYMVIVNER